MIERDAVDINLLVKKRHENKSLRRNVTSVKVHARFDFAAARLDPDDLVLLYADFGAVGFVHIASCLRYGAIKLWHAHSHSAGVPVLQHATRT